MRIPLTAGRYFDERDRQQTETVAIVNEALVAKYFAAENPIGKRIREFDGPGSQRPWLRIVGVVAGEKRTAVVNEMSWADSPVIYHAWDQDPPVAATLIVRSAAIGTKLGAAIPNTLWGIDPDVSIGEIESVPQTVAKALAYPRFRAEVLAGFSGLALLLAMVGMYGVLSNLVTHRTHEIGVRMALGAQRGEVLGMVVGDGARLIAAGVALGLAGEWALGRYLGALLYGISPADPLLLASISFGMILAALAAMYVPARRAATVDPLVALRYE